LLNTLYKNISTVEDPVEINLMGINQVHVNPKIGLTFANTLRAFLRQDPDIIMVGEIRDFETAEIAIKAAQTGHLVLSTVHTNNAAETLTRLINMGIAPFNLASSITLIIAQRLVRKLCLYCKKPQHLPIETLVQQGFAPEETLTLELFAHSECKNCIKGYKGRVGIYEILPMTESIAQMIMTNNPAPEIAKAAKKLGMKTLRQSALAKVKQGMTSLEEINRVLGGNS
jgi:type IV pilus assembly protein PilB